MKILQRLVKLRLSFRPLRVQLLLGFLDFGVSVLNFTPGCFKLRFCLIQFSLSLRLFVAELLFPVGKLRPRVCKLTLGVLQLCLFITELILGVLQLLLSVAHKLVVAERGARFAQRLNAFRHGPNGIRVCVRIGRFVFRIANRHVDLCEIIEVNGAAVHHDIARDAAPPQRGVAALRL